MQMRRVCRITDLTRFETQLLKGTVQRDLKTQLLNYGKPLFQQITELALEAIKTCLRNYQMRMNKTLCSPIPRTEGTEHCLDNSHSPG